MTIRTLDSKGRLVLGPQFANRLVIVDDSDETRIIITPAKAVPVHEAWLYNNDAAMKSVLLGIQQAQDERYAANPPDVDADLAERSEE
jgi:hypothetical protein